MPHPPEPEPSPGPSVEELSVYELEQELTRVKVELEEYQGLIEELPTIYEGKFRNQLRDVAQDIRRLLDEQQALQDQIRHALASGQQPVGLPASPVVPQSAVMPTTPAGPSRPRLVLTAAITTLLVAVLVAGLGLWRRSRVPQLATPAVPPTAPQAAIPTPASASKPGSQPEEEPQLRLRVNGECWIKVQTLAGKTVLESTFQNGEMRSLPLGEGLRVLAGRPDLLEVSVAEADFSTIGPIDRIDWVVIRPPGSPEGSS